jgi:hypothetical protein
MYDLLVSLFGQHSVISNGALVLGSLIDAKMLNMKTEMPRLFLALQRNTIRDIGIFWDT